MSDRVTKSIFKAIDSGSYKIAKDLSSEQLKKYPNSSYYYALDNYVLLMSGERDEAIKLSRQLMDKTPSDPNTLELLNIIFRRVGLLKESVQVYENACKKYANLNLVQAWYDLSIKNFDIASLQKSTMLLVRLSPSDEVRELKFSASFNLLIASELDKITIQQKKLFPKLGLKMVEELKPFKDAQEMYVYVKLLLLNDRTSDAVSELTNFLKTETDLELQIILLDVLTQQEDWSQLFEFTKDLLFNKDFNDWNTWCLFIKSGVAIDQTEAVEQLITSAPTSRNSKLALLELCQYSKEDSEAASVKHFEEYVNTFGGKPCCFPDLKRYISSISTESLMTTLENQFCQRNLDSLKLNDKEPLMLNQVTFLVNYMRFKTYLTPESVVSKDYIQLNLEYYNLSKHLLKTKVKTDYFIGNEFLLMICNSILRTGNGSTESILKCIVILENALKTDVHEFHLRLWLIRLYSQINCYAKAQAHYDTLKIKNVQDDTLAHYLFNDVAISYPTAEVEHKFTVTQRIYVSNQRETTYCIRAAYQKGTFSKLKGFLDFGMMLNNSLSRYLNTLELCRLGRITGNDKLYVKNLDSLERIYKTSISTELDYDLRLCDNRDFKTLWDFGTFEQDPIVDTILFGPHKSHVYVSTMISKELLVSNNKFQAKWDEYIFYIEKNLKSPEFSEVERWSASLLLELISAIKKNENINLDLKLKSVSDHLSTSVATALEKSSLNGLFVVLDTTKSLNSIKSNYRNEIDQSLNKKITLSAKLLVTQLRSSSVDLKAQISSSLKDHEKSLKQWVSKDLESLAISSSTIEDIFTDIKESLNRQVSILTRI